MSIICNLQLVCIIHQLTYFYFFSGNNNIVIIAGANNELHCSDVENAENLIRNSKVVMFQLETPLESTIRALEICEKHSCT